MKKQAFKIEKTFVEALQSGEIDYNNIDEYIAKWHDGDYTCSISEFLGMTKQQYFDWMVGQDEYLRKTFQRKNN